MNVILTLLIILRFRLIKDQRNLNEMDKNMIFKIFPIKILFLLERIERNLKKKLENLKLLIRKLIIVNKIKKNI